MTCLRSCYRSQMRLYRDRPDILTWGRWHFCKPGAAVVPYYHLYGSYNWDWDERIDPPVGEVGTGPHKWVNGAPIPRVLGLNTCGTKETWEQGALYAARGTMAVAPDGVPLCCLASPIGPGGDCEGGECLQGWGFTLSAENGESEGGHAVQYGDELQYASGGDADDGHASQYGYAVQAAAGGDSDDGDASQSLSPVQAAAGGDSDDGSSIQALGVAQFAGGGDAEDGSATQALGVAQYAGGGVAGDGSSIQALGVSQFAGGGVAGDGSSTQVKGWIQQASGGDSDDGSATHVVGYDSVWTKYTLPYTSFQTAGLTITVTVASLPALTWLHGVALNVTTNFAGAGIGTCTAQAKWGASNVSSPQNVLTGNVGFIFADGSGAQKAGIPDGVHLGLGSFTASKDVTILMTASGANLSALTAGSLDVWLNVSTMP